jgi:SWI/SNF-related matrix-associated actin-dependent regulator 1 of chromatin subfamily A
LDAHRLFPFQHESVQFLKERKYALLALEQGLGKTIVAIAAAKVLREEKMLVVCPSAVKYNWEREIKAWDPSASVHIIDGSTWKCVPAKYTIINYDLIHKAGIARHLLKMQFNVLILDEAHYLKNSRAKRTKTVYSHNGLADNAVRVWLMTGTPVLNRPVEIFPMLRRFMPERLGKYADYMAFTKRFCSGYQGKWGWDDTGASHLEELASYLDGFMLRRLKKDVMKDLPDKIFQKIVFDAPTAAVKSLVKKEKAEFKEEMFGAFSSLRQEMGLAKLPMVVEHLTNLLEETDKVIVFAHHRKVLETLRARLKDYNPVLLYGGLTAQQKQRVIDDFVTDRNKRVFLGQIDAAGIGIDGLQKVANTVVFAEISWVPGQIKQAIDRCHRIGQVNKVLVQFLMMKGGIDEQIYDSLSSKSTVIKKIMVSNLVAKEVGRRFGNIVEPPLYGRSPLVEALPLFKAQNEVRKKELLDMAKHSLEDNIERIADALEKLTAPSVATVAVDDGGQVTAAPVAPKAAKKAKPAAAPEMDAQGLLAYSNKKVLAINDPEVRKSTVQSIVARLKTECGVTNIKSLPAEQIATAKTIVDEVFNELDAGL